MPTRQDLARSRERTRRALNQRWRSEEEGVRSRTTHLSDARAEFESLCKKREIREGAVVTFLDGSTGVVEKVDKQKIHVKGHRHPYGVMAFEVTSKEE